PGMSYHVTRCNKVARRTDWPCRPCQPQQCRATRNGVPARWLHTEAACQTISTRADLAATFFLPKRVTLAIPDPAQAPQIRPALSAAPTHKVRGQLSAPPPAGPARRHYSPTAAAIPHLTSTHRIAPHAMNARASAAVSHFPAAVAR